MSDAIDNLLVSLLARQPDTLESTDLDRLEQECYAHFRGEPLPPERLKAMWSSARARAIFLKVRTAVLSEVRDNWSANDNNVVFSLRAADSPTGKKKKEALRLGDANLAVEVRWVDAMESWMISLIFSGAAARFIPAGIRVRMTDEGGKVWIEGELGNRNAVDTFWSVSDESPIERLRRYSVALEFV